MDFMILAAGAVTLVAIGALTALWARQRRGVASSSPADSGYYSTPDTTGTGSWSDASCGDTPGTDGGGDCGGGDGGGGGGDGGGGD